jgi:hypothetical protein
MERQFNNGDFEKLLRDNANQYRMYPSEKVWKGVHSALHTRRRWYGLTAAIMFLVTGSIVSFVIFNDKPGKNNISEQKIIPTQSISEKQNSSPVATQFPFTPKVKRPEYVEASVSDLTKTYLSNHNSVDPLAADNSSEQEYASSDQNKITMTIEPVAPVLTTEESHTFSESQSSLTLINDHTKAEIENQVYFDASSERKLESESLLNDNIEQKIKDAISALSSQNVSTVHAKKKAKVTGQLYFTPTISYRKLTENKRVFNGRSYYVPVIDLKYLVKHKPAMGLEFGFEGRYHMNDNLSLKAGLQFNINRYDISAYSHPTEIATVALNSGYGVDSLATLSNYRNSNSNSTDWLENFSFQTSLPIGGELILGRTKSIQWGINATIQPTYVIGDRAYVISSDYKNYAKFPDLMRRWNVSTGAGAFVSYSTGRIQWQAGPHFRYQHLSSFVNALTIKEKLYAFGLKVGATLNNKK